MSSKTITADDLTGEDLTGTGFKPRKVTFDGKAGNLDLSDTNAEAVAEFLAGNGTAKLAALLAPAPAVTSKTARKRPSGGSTATGDVAEMRAWLRKNRPDLGVGEKGRIKPEHKAVYEASKAGASGPAVNRPVSVPDNKVPASA